MQGRRAADFEYVDDAIRARQGRCPPCGGAPHPADAPGGGMDGH